MSTLATPQPTALLPLPSPADVYRISVDLYERMIDSGSIGEDEPIELLNGVLVRKMPKNPRHMVATELGRRAIDKATPSGWHVRGEGPVRIPNYDEPEPDLAVVRGDVDEYSARHPVPGEIALLVEVADSSLARDRGEKRDIYARAGIAFYWIVNLVDRQLEVYANPVGGVYPAPMVLDEPESVELFIDGQTFGPIPVAAMFPRQPS